FCFRLRGFFVAKKFFFLRCCLRHFNRYFGSGFAALSRCRGEDSFDRAGAWDGSPGGRRGGACLARESRERKGPLVDFRSQGVGPATISAARSLELWCSQLVGGSVHGRPIALRKRRRTEFCQLLEC